MNRFVALLRAINVGGTGTLPMADLLALAQSLGFDHAKTYIASGNLVFSTPLDAITAQSALANRLADHMGKPVGTFLRDQAQMHQILRDNPFAAHPANQTTVMFLDTAPPPDILTQISGQQDEQCHHTPGSREIYLCYPSGMGRSKLRLPTAAASGTARNINTVTKLAAMLDALA